MARVQTRPLWTAWLAGALLTAGVPGAGRAEWTEEPIGRTSVLRLRSAPFPHASRPQYQDDRVLAFVPAALAQPGPTVDVIVHYHGHRAEAVSDADRRRLRQQLADSGLPAILLAPQGPLRAADSGGGKHETQGGLRRFLDEAFARLIADGVLPPGTRPGRVILSGHSGGYKVIAAALQRGEVDVSEVWLHDAVYAHSDVFADWARRPGRRLVSTHTERGGTRGNNQDLARRLRAAGVPVVTDERALDGAQAAILAVPEGHHDVTRRFGAFARTSPLRPRRVAATPPPPPPAGRGFVDALGDGQ